MKRRNYYDEEHEEEELYQTEATPGSVERLRPQQQSVQKAHKDVRKHVGAAASSNDAGGFFNSTAVASNPHFALQRDMWSEQQGSRDHEHCHLQSEMHYHSDTGAREHADHEMLCGHTNYTQDYNAVMPLTLHHPDGCTSEESFLDESHLGAPEQEARWLRRTLETMYNPPAKGCSPHDNAKSRVSPALFKTEHDGLSDAQNQRSWQQECSGGGSNWDQTQFAPMMPMAAFDSEFGRYSLPHMTMPRPNLQEGPPKCTVTYHYV
jgi:hypothetical protein